MTFTTFRAESKAFMGYDRLDWRGKIGFWLRYPMAAARFYSFALADWWSGR